MSTADDTTRLDDRAQQLVTLGRLLHVAGIVPLLLALAAYYMAVRAPLSAKEQELGERIATVTGLLEQTSDLRERLKRAEAELEHQRQRAVDVRKRIPDRPDDAEYLRSASQAAAESALSIKDYSRGVVTRNATFSQIDIQLECEGTYESICGFLHRMEQIPRVARVVSMEITADSADGCYPLVLVIRLYFSARKATDLNQTTLHDRSQPEVNSVERGRLCHGCGARSPARRWHG